MEMQMQYAECEEEVAGEIDLYEPVLDALSSLASSDEDERIDAAQWLARLTADCYGEEGEMIASLVRAHDGVPLLAQLLVEDCAEAHEAALQLLGNLCSNAVDPCSDETKALLKQCASDQRLVDFLSSEETSIACYACGLLQNLSGHTEWARVVYECGGLPLLEKLLRHRVEVVRRFASGALVNAVASLQRDGVLPSALKEVLSTEALEAIFARIQQTKLEAFGQKRAERVLSRAAARLAPVLQRRIELENRRAEIESSLLVDAFAEDETAYEADARHRAAAEAAAAQAAFRLMIEARLCEEAVFDDAEEEGRRMAEARREEEERVRKEEERVRRADEQAKREEEQARREQERLRREGEAAARRQRLLHATRQRAALLAKKVAEEAATHRANEAEEEAQRRDSEASRLRRSKAEAQLLSARAARALEQAAQEERENERQRLIVAVEAARQQRIRDAAVRLQSRARMRCTRSAVHTMRRSRHVAALVLQANARRRACIRRFSSVCAAILTVQLGSRRLLLRLGIRRRRSWRAAVRLQAAWRRHLAPDVLKELRQVRREGALVEAAAVRLQTAWRRRRSRQCFLPPPSDCTLQSARLKHVNGDESARSLLPPIALGSSGKSGDSFVQKLRSTTGSSPQSSPRPLRTLSAHLGHSSHNMGDGRIDGLSEVIQNPQLYRRLRAQATPMENPMTPPLAMEYISSIPPQQASLPMPRRAAQRNLIKLESPQTSPRLARLPAAQLAAKGSCEGERYGALLQNAQDGWRGWNDPSQADGGSCDHSRLEIPSIAIAGLHTSVSQQSARQLPPIS